MNLKIDHAMIKINDHQATSGKKIYFDRLEKLIFLPKAILVKYKSGAHEKIKLRMYKQQQIFEIKRIIEKFGRSHSVLIEEAKSNL
jgi:hypothetical protein